jgi:hypothetical protein
MEEPGGCNRYLADQRYDCIAAPGLAPPPPSPTGVAAAAGAAATVAATAAAASAAAASTSIAPGSPTATANATDTDADTATEFPTFVNEHTLGHCMKGDFFCEYFAIPALVIVFRETLEATVLLAVLLQFLKRAGQVQLVLLQSGPC